MQTHVRTGAILTVSLATFVASTAMAAISLQSVDLSGGAAGGVVFNRNPGSTADMSPDGRFVIFTSTASNLVSGITDTNNGADVFLRDLETGTTAILSVDSAGTALGTVGNTTFGAFVFSPDSTRLLFRTQATGLIAGLADTNVAPDWFVRDLAAGTTSCVTINAAGTSTGNSTSFTSEPPVFSPDGKLLAFISLAGDLVGGVTDPTGRDLFVRDLDAQTTALVSVTTTGTASGLTTDDAAKFSPNGRYLAFLDGSGLLVDGVTDTNAFTDLFVRDLETDTTYLVTRKADDTAATFSSAYEWAPDGHAILFGSGAVGVVAGVTDTNNLDDLFLWDTDTRAISMVSVSPDGTAAGDKISRSAGFSPDSRFVAFGSASTNLTPESAGGDVKDDLYVRDTQTNTTAYVAQNLTGSVVLGLVLFSPDGVHLLYKSNETDVVAGIADTNGTADLFLYNLQTGAKSAVTVNADGTAMANTQGTLDDVVLSPNGQYLSFVSDADDLVPGFTTTSTRDLFVRDLVAGVTSLVTVYINGGGAGYDQGATRDAEFSPDSRFLVFNDNALLASPVTTPLNFTYAQHLYAYDVVTNSQNLLSVNAAGNAPASNGGLEPFSFIVNPAGGSVFFLSTSTDMVTGVADEAFTFDAFVAELPTTGAASACADPVADGSLAAGLASRDHLVKASDALFILRAAVGSGTCELCVCDVNGSTSITASDALVALKIAVGQEIELQCPAC